MAKQTAFFAQENHHVPCSGSRARLYDLCKLQNHPYIQYVYSRAVHVRIADRPPKKNEGKRMVKSGSENTGNATNFSGCPPCKKHTWLIVKNTSHVF